MPPAKTEGRRRQTSADSVGPFEAGLEVKRVYFQLRNVLCCGKLDVASTLLQCLMMTDG